MNRTAKTFPDLPSYLERIGFRADARPDFATLAALQSSHVRTVPFENIDVQLRRPVGLELDAVFDKIVRRHRGGWCYELNGVFGWALEAIGFNVTRICAGVMRERAGDVQLGNHLCLLVHLDRTYLVDVGFGGSLLLPLPIEESDSNQPPYRLSLRTADDYWRFVESAHGAPFSFDFKIDPANEALFAAKCEWLQKSAESPFVQNLVVQRRDSESHLSLRGRVLTTLSVTGEKKQELSSPEQLVQTLRDTFDLSVPEVATLWPSICARHEALFKSSQANA